MSQLPQLPEPAAHLADSLPLFTEAQMLAYAAATVEACAAVCEGISEFGAEKDCADAIRSLLK